MNIGYSILQIDENDNIINRLEILNQNLMQIDITKDIYKQASNLGYDDIYTIEDIDKKIEENIREFGE